MGVVGVRIVWRHQTQAGGLEVESWRWTKADPSVSLASLVDAIVDKTSLCSEAQRQTMDTGEHAHHPPPRPSTLMHPWGLRLGPKGKWGGGTEWKGRQGRAAGTGSKEGPAQQNTQHTAGQAAYRRAGSTAPGQAPGTWRPSPASAFKILLFQRQRLNDLEGSLDPGPGAWGLGRPVPLLSLVLLVCACLPPALPVFSHCLLQAIWR